MEQQQRHPVLEIVLTTASGLIVAWSVLPPQQRYWIRLEMLDLLRRTAARHARQAGYLGMGDELAGRQNCRYQVAYRLSQARDWCGRALEGMRP